MSVRSNLQLIIYYITKLPKLINIIFHLLTSRTTHYPFLICYMNKLLAILQRYSSNFRTEQLLQMQDVLEVPCPYATFRVHNSWGIHYFDTWFYNHYIILNASFMFFRSSKIGDKGIILNVKQILSTQNDSNVSKQSLNLLPLSINLSDRVVFTAYIMDLMIINANDLNVKRV